MAPTPHPPHFDTLPPQFSHGDVDIVFKSAAPKHTPHTVRWQASAFCPSHACSPPPPLWPRRGHHQWKEFSFGIQYGANSMVNGKLSFPQFLRALVLVARRKYGASSADHTKTTAATASALVHSDAAAAAAAAVDSTRRVMERSPEYAIRVLLVRQVVAASAAQTAHPCSSPLFVHLCLLRRCCCCPRLPTYCRLQLRCVAFHLLMPCLTLQRCFNVRPSTRAGRSPPS